jgi:homoserine kinase type II
MYLGVPDHAQELIQAYLDHGTLEAAEVQHGLAAMLRFRWAVQANYFAWRIAENDLTGISGPEGNEKGLEDARRSLTTSGRRLSSPNWVSSAHATERPWSDFPE